VAIELGILRELSRATIPAHMPPGTAERAECSTVGRVSSAAADPTKALTMLARAQAGARNSATPGYVGLIGTAGGERSTRSSSHIAARSPSENRSVRYSMRSSCRGCPNTMRYTASVRRRSVSLPTSRLRGMFGTHRSMRAPPSTGYTQYGIKSVSLIPLALFAASKAVVHGSRAGSASAARPCRKATFF